MTEHPRLVVVVTGVGAHSDPWHGLAATSAEVSALLAERFTVRGTTTDAIDVIEDADLVVLNVSGDLAQDPADSRAIVDALLAATAQGTPILALHSSSLAFRDDPRWAELLGGRWVPGTSMHPQIGAAIVQLDDGAAFELYDERYTALERRDGTELVAFHTEDGMTHPLVWVRRGVDGSGAVAYDALGHGVESYLAEGHRRMLTAIVEELVGGTGAAVEPAPAAATRLGGARGRWDGLVVEALGYELIALSQGSEAADPPGFTDAFLAAGPVRRLVAGYLGVESEPGSGALRVIGHGVPTAELLVDGHGLRVGLAQPPSIDGRVLWAPEAGLAIVAEHGDWSTDHDGSATLTGEGWRAVVVHGPASAKVENRIRLLDDVRRLDGPRGDHHD